MKYLLVWEPNFWWNRPGQWRDGGHVGAAFEVAAAAAAASGHGGLVAVGGAVAVVVRDALLLVHRGVRQLLNILVGLEVTFGSYLIIQMPGYIQRCVQKVEG